ncbi:hypothetical protein VTI74DRAFT_10182 [Chaetomium olivicolor]
MPLLVLTCPGHGIVTKAGVPPNNKIFGAEASYGRPSAWHKTAIASYGRPSAWHKTAVAWDEDDLNRFADSEASTAIVPTPFARRRLSTSTLATHPRTP